ncbi:MAG: TIGR03936 family radical SAM-associated protein, partial [Candidatus Latescibacterota bacterium]
VSLISLSSSDYPGLDEVIKLIGAQLSGKAVSISLSSLRADNFSLAIANNTAGGRKTGLTFAIEAGTQRLRDVINKNLTEEQLTETIKSALEGGWTGFKLYFMIGLPTETDEDIVSIALMLNRFDVLLRQYRGRHINVTVSTFSPKSMTPFQWENQDSISELSRKMRLLRSHLIAKSVVLKETNPEVSMLENRLGRGGRETSSIILDAWKMGSRLDGWSEHFDGKIWREAFLKAGISLEEGGGGCIPGSPLPWGHIHFGVDESYLLSQRETAYRGETVPDCSISCQKCGPYAPFCSSIKKGVKTVSSIPPDEKKIVDTRFGRKKKIIVAQKVVTPVITGMRFRMKYTKKGPIRFIGHLDLVRIFDRVMRRAGIPIAYSQGFHPHPKISFGPPLSLGMSSTAEYVDFSLSAQFEDVGKTLAKGMMEGMEVVSVRPISEKAESLTKIITLAEYNVHCAVNEKTLENIATVLESDHIVIQRTTKNGMKEVDIRPGIIDMIVAGDGSGFTMILSLETGKSVKPSEILELIMRGEPSSVTRTEQYAEVQGKRVSPLEIVR